MKKIYFLLLFLIFTTACYAGKVGNLEVENSITLPSGSISEGSLPATALIDSDIGSSVQAYDADLDDLSDGSLTGSKVGSGINGANIANGDYGDVSVSSGTWTVDSGAASTYDTIQDPVAESTIAFAGFTLDWTTNETASDFFNITNSGNFGDVSLFVLQSTGNPTNGTMFEIINTDTNVDSIIAPNFSLTQAGLVTATFSGSGASLTGLNATQLTTGTVPAARVGADHIDTITEIASGLKDGTGACSSGLLCLGGHTHAISSEVSGLGAGVATFLATPSTANFASAVTGETGSGAVVFGTSPTIATPVLTGKIDRNNVAVDDDDCTGEQGLYWYDTTDSAFEFCNANSGTPTVLGSGSSTALQQKDRTLENPQDADSFILLKASAAFTITDIHCIVDPADTGESVVIDVQECTSTGDTCVTVDATITCDNDGAEDDGTLTNGAIDAGDWILLDIGTVTGTVSQLTVSIYY